MKKMLINAAAALLSLSLSLSLCFSGVFHSGQQASAASLTASAISFKDITPSHWAYSSIVLAADDGFIKGFTDGTFKPNNPVTRAEFISVLVRSSGSDQSQQSQASASANTFKDVPSTYWAAADISAAVNRGFLNPKDFPDGNFKPNQKLTRYEMAKWLVQGLMKSGKGYDIAYSDTKNTLLPFVEAGNGKISKAMTPYIAVALGTELMTGLPDGNFGVSNTTTRAETAVLIYRYLNVASKEATSFNHLNELREVGTTGTNVVSLGHADFSSYKNSLADVIGHPINFDNGLATAKIEKYIIVDNDPAAKDRGVYADFFATFKSTDKRFPNDYETYALLTITTKAPVDTIEKLRYGVPFVTSGFSLDEKQARKFGLQTYDRPTALALHNKGAVQTFWLTDLVGKKHDLFPIVTADGLSTTILYK